MVNAAITALSRQRKYPLITLLKLRNTPHHPIPTTDADRPRYKADGKTLLSGGQDGQILRWSINSGQVVGVYRVFRDGWVSATASGAIHWGENGLRHLRFVDPDQHAIIPTRWHAEDLLPNGLLPEGTRLV